MRIPASTIRLLVEGRLARSARAAADRASRHDPAFYTRDCDDRRATLRRELADDVADVFGVSPWEVTVTDDHVRDSWGIRWFRVAITDDENEYRFTTCATVTTLRILGPYPHCGGDVPISEGTELATLGRYLNARLTGHGVPTPPEYGLDPGHTKKCPRP